MWWETLGISPDASQKTIKQAYARLLKKTRPDDDPEGFKALRIAYQQALAWQAEQEEDEWELAAPPNNANPSISASAVKGKADDIINNGISTHSSIHVANKNQVETDNSETVLPPQEAQLSAPIIAPEPLADTPTISQLPAPAKLEEPISLAPEAQIEKDWISFQKQFSINLHTEMARANASYWTFIEKLPSFADLEFREHLSHELFRVISEANVKALGQKTLFIKQPVLQYLDQLFDWDQQWQRLREQFGEAQTDAVLVYLTPPSTHHHSEKVTPRNLSYMRRIFAYTLDMVVFFIPLDFILNFLKADYFPSIDSFLMSFLVWLLLYPLVEASQWQGSLGKKIFKLQVVNKHHQRLPLWHAYIRHLITLICLLGFKITIFFNIFLIYRRNLLLQDWISRSYVVGASP